MRRKIGGIASAALLVPAVFALSAPAYAGQVGTIFVCYACQNTGNTIIDTALTANPSVAFDGILFAFINTSAFSITGGVFSLSNNSPADSFALPTIAAGGTFILMPGITSDGNSHPVGGLFASTGITKDTSDGDGNVTDASIFSFTGTNNGLAVTSTTFGSSTGTAGTFTPGDPGLTLPYRDNPGSGSTTFLGLGPNGDGGCNNCYYGEVATLNTPAAGGGVPEPQTLGLAFAGLAAMGWIARRRIVRG